MRSVGPLILICSSALVPWVTNVSWGAPAGSLDALLTCRSLADPTARLACFDRETATLSSEAAGPAARASAPHAAAAPSAAAPAAPAPPAAPAGQPDPQKQFGLPEKKVAAQEVAAGTRAADAAQVEAHITQLAPAGDQRLVFTLDNGQVWRQLSVQGEMLAKAGDAVTISRGMLGSYWLRLNSGRGCKVTRLR